MENLGLNVTDDVAAANPGADWIVRSWDAAHNATDGLCYCADEAGRLAHDVAASGNYAVVYVAKAVFAPPSGAIQIVT